MKLGLVRLSIEGSYELRFTTLGLGTPAPAAAPSPFPESRHLFGFHVKPYCPGHFARHE
jgi:hypothetical protein